MSEKKIYDDSLFINESTIQSYANTNEAHLTLPVRGIVLELPGLGGSSCLGGYIERGDYATPQALDFAAKGIVIAYLFPGPWSWGNKGAVRMGDAVVRALAKKYDLGENFPLVVCGGSMGGMGSLMFACDTTLPLSGVAAACPCIDCLDRLNSHPDFPRTYVSAVAAYDMPLEDAIRAISPLHRIADLPRVPFFICSDAEDELFPEQQCDDFIDRMKEMGHDVIYHRQPGQGHGGFFPEVRQGMHDFICARILGA